MFKAMTGKDVVVRPARQVHCIDFAVKIDWDGTGQWPSSCANIKTKTLAKLQRKRCDELTSVAVLYVFRVQLALVVKNTTLQVIRPIRFIIVLSIVIGYLEKLETSHCRSFSGACPIGSRGSPGRQYLSTL